MRLALFDLDHTLLPLDSDYSWGQFTVTIGWRDAESHTRANDAFYEQYKAGTLDIHEYTRFSVAPLAEHGVAQNPMPPTGGSWTKSSCRPCDPLPFSWCSSIKLPVTRC